MITQFILLIFIYLTFSYNKSNIWLHSSIINITFGYTFSFEQYKSQNSRHVFELPEKKTVFTNILLIYMFLPHFMSFSMTFYRNTSNGTSWYQPK